MKEGERKGGRKGEGLTQSLQCTSGRAMASNAGPLALGRALGQS